jgi:hypothetical protein
MGSHPNAHMLACKLITSAMKEQKTNLLAGCFNIHCHCISYGDYPVQHDIWRDPNLSR